MIGREADSARHAGHDRELHQRRHIDEHQQPSHDAHDGQVQEVDPVRRLACIERPARRAVEVAQRDADQEPDERPGAERVQHHREQMESDLTRRVRVLEPARIHGQRKEHRGQSRTPRHVIDECRRRRAIVVIDVADHEERSVVEERRGTRAHHDEIAEHERARIRPECRRRPEREDG